MFDFPNSPTTGQRYVPTAGGPAWQWNGTAWTSSGGSSLGMQIVDTIFTASGTYTPGNGVLYADAQCWGAGGAGGGAQATGASTLACGGGGNAGAWAQGLFTAAQLGASQAITIGAGGTGVAGIAGNAGGGTSFGSLVVAAGGTGGSYVSAGGANAIAMPSAPIQSSAGAILGWTQVGQVGFASNVNGWGGFGGQSIFGGGGWTGVISTTTTTGTNGAAAQGRAAGGGGAINAFSQAARPGGAGGNGMVWVREYYAFAGQAPAPGTIIERVYTGASTWTKPAGLMALEVEIQSPGGGGGGAPATGASQYSVGGGGGSGALGRQLYQANDPVLTATVAVTIGSFGTGSVGLSGGTGGTSSFGTGISVSGGVGGLNGAAGATSTGSPGAGGIVSNGAVAVKGGRGLWGYAVFAATYLNFGQGADGPSGSGGQNTVAPGGTGGGTAGTGYGAGGGGGTALASAGAQTGGQGAPSYVKVREFY